MSLMTAEKRAPAPAGRTQLRDLVARRRAELGLSYKKLAAACIDPETGVQTVKDSWLHRLETGLTVLPPELPELQGMAAGLRLPLQTLKEAAGAQFFGLDTVREETRHSAPDVVAMVSDYQSLTEEDRIRVQEIIKSFRRIQKAES